MDRLHLMQVFTRIVESGSFSAVAKEMNMLQPTVSKHMNALENILGVRLLNRTTRKLSITDSGKEYYQRAKRILDERIVQASIKDAEEEDYGVFDEIEEKSPEDYVELEKTTSMAVEQFIDGEVKWRKKENIK